MSVACAPASLVPRSVAIIGSAGRYMSMANGPTAVSSPSTIALLANDGFITAILGERAPERGFSRAFLCRASGSYMGSCCVATSVEPCAEQSAGPLVLHGMDAADTYEIVRHPEGWAIRHRDELKGPYATKQAAFE